jgi:hypothetical protein
MTTGNEAVLRVDRTEGFRAGDVFYYEDLQAGDEFEILTQAEKRYR